MAYREKIAWTSLLSLMLTFGPYLTWVAIEDPATNGLPQLTVLTFFAAAAGGYAVLTGLARFVLRLTSPNEDLRPTDERDRAIEHRSMKTAYWALVIGMIVVGCVMPFTQSGWAIVNAAVAAMVIAEVSRCIAAGISYRRSAA